MITLNAVVVTMIVLRWFYFLGFGGRTSVLLEVVKMAGLNLLVLLMSLVVICAAFAASGLLLYGYRSKPAPNKAPTQPKPQANVDGLEVHHCLHPSLPKEKVLEREDGSGSGSEEVSYSPLPRLHRVLALAVLL